MLKPNKEHAISFEFFPPKTDKSKQNLIVEALLLSKMQPHFFSVTYGAGGGTREGTIQTVKEIQKHTKHAVAPHLSCIGSTRAELIEVIKIYQSLGINRIVALRGDIPEGMNDFGELSYAYELVELIREMSGDEFYIEVAAYPEYHPEAASSKADILNLQKKVAAGANSAITQYFYNPDAYFYFLDVCEKASISIPIIPGIMPITCYQKLMRFSKACGAEIPQWIRKQLEGYADDVESVKLFGLDLVHQLCERLIEGGAPGLHFYTLNQAEPTVSLVKRLYPAHFVVVDKKSKAV